MSMSKEPEQVMKLRGGSVLGKRTILKSDHFPGCQNKRLSPQIDGAPIYRQVDSLHVQGVAIPTLDGIRNVLKHIGAEVDGKRAKILRISLREEPVVYVNGHPFVLWDIEKPFPNLNTRKQLQSLRNFVSVKLESRQMQSMRSMPSVKLLGPIRARNES